MIEFIKKSDSKALVIFVHGFMGNIDTWKNEESKKCFPELLKENTVIDKNFDFAYFNYETKLFNKNVLTLKKLFKNTMRKKNLDIKEIANEFESTIRFKCKEYEDIIIIAHSMGGIVTKALLLNENNDCIKEKVKLFISLAVPHSGAGIATWGRIIFNKNLQLKNLEPISTTITELTQNWIDAEHVESIYIVGNYDKVVQANSAIAFDKSKKDIIYTPDDHLSIAKPKSTESLVYCAIEDILINFWEKYNSKKINFEIKKFIDNGEMDKENFVFKLIVADIHKTLIGGAKQSFYNAEYLTRSLGREELEILQEIYVKIKNLYVIYFGKHLGNKNMDNNKFLVEVHEAIKNDNDLDISDSKYMKIFEGINHMHKTGMLHQLADVDQEIIWDREMVN